LQPLLENAIKFGLYDTLGTVLISMRFIQEPHFYKFEITNPFDPASAAPKGTGFGLTGVARRLYLLYARNDLLLIDKIKPEGGEELHTFKATLLIPIDESELHLSK
jgi:two-component system LytT family sensor kinase